MPHVMPHSPDSPGLIVVTATPMEMQAVFALQADQLACGFEWTCLDRDWGRLMLVVCGVGPVNAAMVLGHVLGRMPHVIGVLNLGVAGAFDLKEHVLGQAVLLEREIWPEYGLLTASGLDARGIGLPLGISQNRPVWDRLELEPHRNMRQMGLRVPDISLGVGLTVAGVSGTAQRADQLFHQYKADVENMEGFALAWVCRNLGIPFAQIRTISNLVGSRDPRDWNLPLAKKRLKVIAQSLFSN